MSTPLETEGELTPVTNPIENPYTETTTDENGNTVTTGYDSGSQEVYTGPVSTAPDPVSLPGDDASEGA
ncbi:hypothetical protein [Streptomyces avermitilis]|uniref:hypothetical protein n=1 Tax=Streptomyces avermitilis TaxID=33903 RepID=UPI003826CDAF